MAKEIERFADCFDPVYDEHSKVLLLGSNPPPDSRKAEFYYSGPHNRFWKTIAAVFDEAVPQTIDEKKALCYRHKIALWDVFKACDRVGASDNTIANVEVNDIAGLIAKTNITHVFCLGKTAYDGYLKHALKTVPTIPVECLVSSSGAARGAKTDDELAVHYKEEITKFL